MSTTPVKFLLLVSIFLHLFLSSVSYATAQEPEVDEKLTKEPERITVYGRRDLFSLKREIYKHQVSFYDLYNQLNKNPKYDIVCDVKKVSGSNIPKRGCEPRYIQTARTELTRFTGGASRLRNDVAAQELEAYVKRDRVKSTKLLKKLIKENPELKERFLVIQDLVSELNKREKPED